MKIEKIYLTLIKDKNFKSIYPRPSFFKNGMIFIKLTSDLNYEGYGEVSPYISKPREAMLLIEKIYKKYFRHKEVDLNYVYNLKKKNSNFFFQSILSVFDQAIHDIFAKQKKTSVSKIINSKNLKYVKFYASGGMLFENQSYGKIFEEALAAKDKGYFGYKFRPKLPITNLSHFQRIKNPPKIDIKSLEKFSINLRKKVGEKFKIMIDLGCRLSHVKEVEYLFKMFKEHNYYFVEEPFQRKVSTYQKLKKYCLDVKISGGEHFYSLKEFKKWNKKKIFDFYQPDTNLLLYQEINHIIKKTSLNKIILHNWCGKINLLSNISYACSLNKNILIEKNIFKNPFDDFFISKPLIIKNGKINIQKTYGFGLSIIKKIDTKYEINEKKI